MILPPASKAIAVASVPRYVPSVASTASLVACTAAPCGKASDMSFQCLSTICWIEYLCTAVAESRPFLAA